MAWKILKQYTSNSNQVWVEKLTEADNIESFSTEEEATARIVELRAIDSTRTYKVIST